MDHVLYTQGLIAEALANQSGNRALASHIAAALEHDDARRLRGLIKMHDHSQTDAIFESDAA